MTTPDDLIGLEDELQALRARLDADGCACRRPFPFVRIYVDVVTHQHGPGCPLYDLDIPWDEVVDGGS